MSEFTEKLSSSEIVRNAVNEVDKEKLYYLREKNTGYYLTKKGDTLKLVVNPYFDETNEFAQSEIDELNIGSYEKLEVES